MTQYPYQTAEETPQSYSLGGFESVKPPRGVKPVVIWIEDRIKEVSRAIAEYVEVGMYTKAEEWTPELYQLFHYRKVYAKLVEGQKPTTNNRYTQCPKCGSARICFWMCHDRYGCYDCDWVEGHSA